MTRGRITCLVMLFVLAINLDKAVAAMIVTSDWRGSVEFNSRKNSTAGGSDSTTNQISGDISTKYFIWRPWLATGNARLRLGLTNGSDSSYDTKRSIVSGQFEFRFLPMSKIPLTISYSREDSQIDQDSLLAVNQDLALNEDLVSEHIFINQRFLGKRYKLDLNISEDRDNSSINGVTVSRGYGLGLLNRWKKSDLTTKFSISNVDNSADGEGKDEILATISHNYHPSNQIRFKTFVSSIERDDSILDTNNNLNLYETRISQFSSTANWNSKNKKTRISGGFRVDSLDLSTPSTINALKTVNMSVGVNHKLNKNWTADISTNYFLTDTNKVKAASGDVKAKASYRSDVIDLNKYKYSWNSILSAENKLRSASTDQLYGVSLGHNINRLFKLNKNQKISISGNQSFSKSISSSGSDTLSITHTANALWNKRSLNITNSAQITLNDSRYITDAERSGTSFIRINASRRKMLSRRSSFTGNISHNISHYNSTVGGENSKNSSSSIDVNYQITKPLLYQLISFNTKLKYKVSDISQPAATIDWNNTAKYSIGKLGVTIGYRVRDIGSRTSLFSITIKRRF